MYLSRTIDQDLKDWKNDPFRKPLILRGARQVGKSSAVRELSRSFDYFLEVNFEERKQVQTLFAGDLSPKELCENLSVLYKIPIIAGKTLVFFDEIQSCIPAISSLRFFFELMPELHIIAAGSLLEFAMEEIPSFGVGRLRTLFIYPFSFDEFLLAMKEDDLLYTMQKTSLQHPLNEALHQKLIIYLKRFLVLGGMPEVMSRYSQTRDLLACQLVLDDLLITLQADFTKYKKRVPPSRLLEVFGSVARQTGSKFVYSQVPSESSQFHIKDALELLIMSGLVIPVVHTSGNGVPIGAESNLKKRKMLIFDTGIFQRLMDLEISEILFQDSFSQVNKGSIAELFVGLELLKSASPFQQQQLYYWQREVLNSNAEIDYLVQLKQEILPVEVKAGTSGSMQSLFLFLNEKKRPLGIRFSLENYSSYDRIKVFPLYAVKNFYSEYAKQ
ncbi:MAG: AAA family ATPase [Bacteroidetes bacterium]|nr:AAA family ATPase [Bacteroidota bacterium]